jgi:hypothetical protein
MKTLTDREKWDIGKIAENENYYSSLPERYRTEAVSTVAVLASGQNLEYVPDAVLNKNICRAALTAKDVDVGVLSKISYPEVQKEAIKMFLERGDAPFLIYSFADISDAKMAQDAVKADAYCLQLVPDKLMTAELCKMAFDSPNADKKVLGFIPKKFQTPEIRKMGKDKFGDNQAQKEVSPPENKKGIRI